MYASVHWQLAFVTVGVEASRPDHSRADIYWDKKVTVSCRDRGAGKPAHGAKTSLRK